jgi:hypothetical protein
MCKRLVMGVFAVMSLVVLWWTDAGAATCVQWRVVGGSAMCTAWSTKGVQVEVTYYQDCGEGGSNCSAFVTANADTGDAVALCKNDTTNVITRRDCTAPVSFTGSAFGCEGEFKHEQDETGDSGLGHDKGKHGGGCKQQIILAPVGAAACGPCGNPCQSGETCVDVTPVEMDTTVSATTGFDLLAENPTNAECTGSSCFYEEHCSINPKKIAFIYVGETAPTPPGEPYQCNLTCVESGCGGGD